MAAGPGGPALPGADRRAVGRALVRRPDRPGRRHPRRAAGARPATPPRTGSTAPRTRRRWARRRMTGPTRTVGSRLGRRVLVRDHLGHVLDAQPEGIRGPAQARTGIPGPGPTGRSAPSGDARTGIGDPRQPPRAPKMPAAEPGERTRIARGGARNRRTGVAHRKLVVAVDADGAGRARREDGPGRGTGAPLRPAAPHPAAHPAPRGATSFEGRCRCRGCR